MTRNERAKFAAGRTVVDTRNGREFTVQGKLPSGLSVKNSETGFLTTYPWYSVSRGDLVIKVHSTGRESGPQVELDLRDFRPGQMVEGPARCERKGAPR